MLANALKKQNLRPQLTMSWTLLNRLLGLVPLRGDDQVVMSRRFRFAKTPIGQCPNVEGTRHFESVIFQCLWALSFSERTQEESSTVYRYRRETRRILVIFLARPFGDRSITFAKFHNVHQTTAGVSSFYFSSRLRPNGYLLQVVKIVMRKNQGKQMLRCYYNMKRVTCQRAPNGLVINRVTAAI